MPRFLIPNKARDCQESPAQFWRAAETSLAQISTEPAVFLPTVCRGSQSKCSQTSPDTCETHARRNGWPSFALPRGAARLKRGGARVPVGLAVFKTVCGAGYSRPGWVRLPCASAKTAQRQAVPAADWRAAGRPCRWPGPVRTVASQRTRPRFAAGPATVVAGCASLSRCGLNRNTWSGAYAPQRLSLALARQALALLLVKALSRRLLQARAARRYASFKRAISAVGRSVVGSHCDHS